MAPLSFSQCIIIFTIYSIIGWGFESVWCSISQKKFVNRGFLSGPCCPAYGFGALIIMFASIPSGFNPIIIFITALLTAAILEYFTGWLMENLFKTRWWDYSDRKFNIKGRICLFNTSILGVLGFAALFLLHDFFVNALSKLLPDTLDIISSFLVILLFIDLIYSVVSVSKIEEILESIRKIISDIKTKNQSLKWYEHPDFSLKGMPPVKRLLKAFPKSVNNKYTQEFAILKMEGIYIQRDKFEIRKKISSEWAQTKASYKGITVTELIWVFLIGCILGYIVEIAWCFVTRGYIESRQGMIYGPFNQVYGFGAVSMVLILTPLFRKNNLWVFLGGAAVGGLFEALCSVIQEYWFGSVSWEYSMSSFSLLGGRTDLVYMCFWGVLAVVYMKYIYPRMKNSINKIPSRPKYFLTWIIVILLSANMIISALAVERWFKRRESIPASNSFQVWLDRAYPDEMLRNIYPNLVFSNDEEQNIQGD